MRSIGKKVRVGRFVLALCAVALLGSMLPAHAIGQVEQCGRERPVGYGPLIIRVSRVGTPAAPSVAPALPGCTTPVVTCAVSFCAIQGHGEASSATGGAGPLYQARTQRVPLHFLFQLSPGE